MARARKKNDLDHQIEKLYYLHSQGKMIDVMKITTLYQECRDAVAAGEDLEDAVKAAIERHCQAA